MNEGENSTSEHSNGNENNFGYENPKSSSEEPENLEDNHAKKMNELEKRLEATSNRSNLKEVEVIRPYPVGVGLSSLSFQVQGTKYARLRRQRFAEPTYILLQISNWECSIE